MNIADRDTLEATIWDAISPPEPETSALDGRVEADVAIIGSGITATSTALHLADAGNSVAVLEAKRVGWGCSSRNGGYLGAPWNSLLPDEAVRCFGSERAQRVNQLWAESGKLVSSLVEKHGIECDYRRTGMVWPAEIDKPRKRLDDMAEQWGHYGMRMDTLSREELTGYLATDHYVSGSLTHDNTSMNPAAYVRGLARAAQEAGVAIYSQSPATGIDKQGERWRVSSLDGEILASRVIICTNAYTTALWPGLERTFYPIPFVMFATEPLSDRGRSLLLKDIPFHSVNQIKTFAFFVDAAGRMVGGDFPTLCDNASIEAVAKPFDRKFTSVFPDAPKPNWRHIWRGTLCVMPDSTPRIYELAPGVFAAMGYSGNGVDRGTVVGREIANLITTGDEEACGLWISKPKPVPFARLAPILLRNVAFPVLRQAFR